MLCGPKEIFFSMLKEQRAGCGKNEDVPLAGVRPLDRYCLSHQQRRDHWHSVSGEVGKVKGTGDEPRSHGISFG